MSRRRLFAWFALVLATALPLRGYAAAGMQCAQLDGNASVKTMRAHAAHDRMAADAHSTSRHHEANTVHGQSGDATRSAHGACSVCCCAAVIDIEAFQWPTQRELPVAPPPLAGRPVPAVIPDGLERPPRTLST